MYRTFFISYCTKISTKQLVFCFLIYYYNKAKYLKPPNNLTYIFSNYFRLPIAYVKNLAYLCTINLKQQIYENNKTFIY